MAYYIREDWSIHAEAPGRRVPTVAVFVITPLLGAAFLMFLPVCGFYLVGKELLRIGAEGLASIAKLLTKQA